jgi:hypothetical protein
MSRMVREKEAIGKTASVCMDGGRFPRHSGEYGSPQSAESMNLLTLSGVSVPLSSYGLIRLHGTDPKRSSLFPRAHIACFQHPLYSARGQLKSQLTYSRSPALRCG